MKRTVWNRCRLSEYVVKPQQEGYTENDEWNATLMMRRFKKPFRAENETEGKYRSMLTAEYRQVKQHQGEKTQQTYMTLISQQGLYNTAWKVVNEAEEKKTTLRLDMYVALMTSTVAGDNISKHNGFKRAREATIAAGHSLTIAMYHHMFRVYLKRMRAWRRLKNKKKMKADGALQLFRIVVDVEPFRPSVICWEALLATRYHFTAGLRIFDKMASVGHQPTTQTYVALLQCCKNTADTTSAERVFTLAKRDRVPVTLDMLCALLSVYLSEGSRVSLAKAEKTWEVVAAREPTELGLRNCQKVEAAGTMMTQLYKAHLKEENVGKCMKILKLVLERSAKEKTSVHPYAWRYAVDVFAAFHHQRALEWLEGELHRAGLPYPPTKLLRLKSMTKNYTYWENPAGPPPLRESVCSSSDAVDLLPSFETPGQTSARQPSTLGFHVSASGKDPRHKKVSRYTPRKDEKPHKEANAKQKSRPPVPNWL